MKLKKKRRAVARLFEIYSPLANAFASLRSSLASLGRNDGEKKV